MGGKLTRQAFARLTALVYKYADQQKVAALFEAATSTLLGVVLARRARLAARADRAHNEARAPSTRGAHEASVAVFNCPAEDAVDDGTSLPGSPLWTQA